MMKVCAEGVKFCAGATVGAKTREFPEKNKPDVTPAVCATRDVGTTLVA